MTIQEKQVILADLASQLNGQAITWAIGASGVLFSLGLVSNFNDLDIMTTKEDYFKIISLLDEIASPIEVADKSEYLTSHFATYTYKGLDLDVMAEFKIKHKQGVYEFPMNENAIVRRLILHGIDIPYTSLEDWYVAYMLMKGRDNKVEMIKNHLLSQGLDHPEKLTNALKQPLPDQVSKAIKALLQ